MKKLFALAAIATIVSGTAAFADETIQSTNAIPGSTTSSSTTIMQTDPQPTVIVAPAAPAATKITRTKFKEKRHGFFHKTKIKGETETVSE